jgi:hypothetical protein
MVTRFDSSMQAADLMRCFVGIPQSLSSNILPNTPGFQAPPPISSLLQAGDHLEAHLDGLRIAGPDGWPGLLGGPRRGAGRWGLHGGRPALETGDAAAMASVETAVAQSSPLAREFIAAFGWLSDASFHARARGFVDRRDRRGAKWLGSVLGRPGVDSRPKDRRAGDGLKATPGRAGRTTNSDLHDCC